MTGQYSLFDVHSGKRKPYEYSFQRYIGQEVRLVNGVEGVIVEMEKYYTTVEADGRLYAGTPTTMAPIRKDNI